MFSHIHICTHLLTQLIFKDDYCFSGCNSVRYCAAFVVSSCYVLHVLGFALYKMFIYWISSPGSFKYKVLRRFVTIWAGKVSRMFRCALTGGLTGGKW